MTGDIEVAVAFFERFHSGTARQRAALARRAPLPAIQTMALRHPDPQVRRGCLHFLDHYANDASMATFVEALADPVDFVRTMALHAIPCEGCKTGDMRAADVVTTLAGHVRAESNPELRIRIVKALMQLRSREPAAAALLEQLATDDADAVVRAAATDALDGILPMRAKRFERRQRRHG